MGEMERDGLIAHGASAIIMDRFLKSSDEFKTVICSKCGLLAEHACPQNHRAVNMTHGKPYCRLCNSHDNVEEVVMPFAMKLLTQELMACHIGVRYGLEQD